MLFRRFTRQFRRNWERLLWQCRHCRSHRLARLGGRQQKEDILQKALSSDMIGDRVAWLEVMQGPRARGGGILRAQQIREENVISESIELKERFVFRRRTSDTL